MAVFIRSFYIYSFHAWSVCLFELTSSHFRIQGPEIVVSKSSSFLWNTKITRLITYAQYINNDAHVNMYSHVHVFFQQRQKLNVENFKDISFSYINNGTIWVLFNFETFHGIKHTPVDFHVRVLWGSKDDVILQAMHAVRETCFLEPKVDTPSNSIRIIL